MSIELASVKWTNESVLKFAGERDPLAVMSARAEELTLEALERGWEGPPYDPFKLAEILHIAVVPRDDVADARTVEGERGKFKIEFNPRRPPARIKFSIAHELAHTFFPDCLERARYRARWTSYRRDDWQLEVLCNLGAAEVLMPKGSFIALRDEGYELVHLLELRAKFEVSTEALLRRVVELAREPVGCFAVSPRSGRLRVDYSMFSSSWDPIPSKKVKPPDVSVTSECKAIGYTSSGTESWEIDGRQQTVKVQAVGLPPYPGEESLRVAGLIRPPSPKGGRRLGNIEYVVGNVLQPQGKDRKIIAHVVNDQAYRWGGSGFAAAVKKSWPDVQEDFKNWVLSNKEEFRLGAIRYFERSSDVAIASMVAQHGYGDSERPRIRYQALERCLAAVGQFAIKGGRSVHIPLIGTGYARGNWDVISELIENEICAGGTRVVVYKLPN